MLCGAGPGLVGEQPEKQVCEPFGVRRLVAGGARIADFSTKAGLVGAASRCDPTTPSEARQRKPGGDVHSALELASGAGVPAVIEVDRSVG
jgi:hypothetical protein